MYLISAPIFMLFTMGAGFSQSFASFLVCRLFAGLTGSPALAVGKFWGIFVLSLMGAGVVHGVGE